MHASQQQAASLATIDKRADFLKINRQCKKWTSQSLVLQALSNDSGVMRVGYTVTKKTESSAVKRNRIKRRLRAAAADILPKHAKTSCDYVLIGRSQAATRPYEALCNDIKWCLEKMNLSAETP